MAASAAAARQAAPARAPRRTPARAPRRKGAPRPRARNAAVAGAALLPHAAVGAAGAVRDLSDSSLIMRLTRGRGWIAVLCALLGGIVALNVISLSLNADAGRLGLQIDRLETQNSALRAQVAERLSASRVETAATTLGLANPDPEEISYLSAKDGDAGKLARLLSTGELLTEPSQPSSYPSAGESYGLAPSSPTTDTTTTTPAPSPAPSPPPSTGTSSGESTGTAPSAPSSGTTGGVGL
jgi:cell division protein FtsL